MSTRIVSGTEWGTGVGYTPTGGDNLFVGLNGLLGSIDSNAVLAAGGNFYASVAGAVYGDNVGMILGDETSDTFFEIHIGQTGTVGGGTAFSVHAFDYRIFNAGTINADDSAIAATVGTGSSLIQNSGAISGGTGISHDGNGALRLVNAGQITGYDGVAVYTGAAADLIYNSGLIDGDIRLGDGADTYQAVGSGAVLGLIDGREGNDIFRVGAAEEKISGGAGIDRVVNASAEGARMSLVDDLGSGVSLGDSYTGIEQLFGSAIGNDRLFGDGATNWLWGRGGNDLISGGGGGDELCGEAGADTLYGGAGNDVFYFTRFDDGADRIMDFGIGDDVVKIRAAGFGAGLTAGPLQEAKFWASTTGLAHDTDDRFMLRTTDKTLWFDPDGSGAQGRVLLADLNDNATFTSGDLLIV